VFAQVKTEEKSKGNEVSTITAIPTLLEMIALKGCIVTIDAADFSPGGAGTK
jgi:predicted transposase YbfD/YdcC